MARIIQTIIYLNLILIYHTNYGQGCVAVRGGGMCVGSHSGNTINLKKTEYSVQVGYRYFQSFRHFRGNVEERKRMEEGSQVINTSNFLDISLNYGITDRVFFNTIIPFVFHHRSSMYEHGGNPPNGLAQRHETIASGLSDIRLGIAYWLLDPKRHRNNYAIGLGIKLPTGRYNAMDTFYNQGASRNQKVYSVVDQSIQPGDGGTGITLDFQGVQQIGHNITLNSSLFYLFNFMETNGVLVRTRTGEFSCPDQFAARVYGTYSHMSGFSFSFGGRLEGIPSSDIFGGDQGFRRPGHIISVEPGLGYSNGKLNIYATLPISLYRNRVQSYSDKITTTTTGVFTQGDAAFADYVINLGMVYRFTR